MHSSALLYPVIMGHSAELRRTPLPHYENTSSRPLQYSDEISGRIARYKATLYMSQFLYSFNITFT